MRIENRGAAGRKPVRFRFDGRWMTGLEGETLAAALIANDVRLVARSFKYHRPRGILTAGPEEPIALVTVGQGAARDPNVRATVLELFDGLVVESQNRWPSLAWDLLSVNNLAAPFLGAGFYYKTFMWPRAFWERIYEPLIRRAAGLGALSGQSCRQPYEKAFAFCDLLVVGGGPTGLMAALAAARAGADVILCDEDCAPGGRLLSERETVGGMAGTDWVAGTLGELHDLGVRVMTRTTVTGAYDQGTYGALERVALPRGDAGKVPLECFWRICARRVVLAAGALERPVAFAGNDRPGVMMAGALRTYVNRWAVAPGRRIAVFGNSDEVYRTADDLVSAGLGVVAVVDSREGTPPERDYVVHRGAVVTGTQGGRHGITGMHVTTGGGALRIPVDVLAMSGGWNPTVHLSCHMNGRPVWREDIAAFVPKEGAVPGMRAAGACNGDFSTRACLQAGADAAREALGYLGFESVRCVIPEADTEARPPEPLWSVPGKGRAWLDFQNDVTVKDVVQAAAENFRSVEHMKRYTTQGMATDQGKISNVTALAVLAEATGQDIPATGTTTFRPPYSPVAIAAMGAGGQGHGFAPQRFTTSHPASVALGAPMIEAGLWYRPSYFPQKGERSWQQSCAREVGMVRNAVGICDVSTLGKIDIQGPGAATFLDLVYANTLSTLKQGRVRYGLMLREDGAVLDDGTCARLGAAHYLMTTTTAAAGAVMQHLEFVHQCLVPHLDLRMISVTEQWAQFAVAGPRSRDLLNGILSEAIDNGSWPFMACGAVRVAGVLGRLFRISFSGEHAYEIAVPARYGAALFDLLLARAVALGGGPYGMEALNVLRIEKGHITHAEIDGRTTAFDIGMARMIAPGKDCIGKVMAERPGLVGPLRRQMVGLRPVAAADQLTAGAALFPANTTVAREALEGHVTSVCHSPTLGHALGLAFLRDGRARHGEVVQMVDQLRGLAVPCIVGDPVQVDPDGGRLRA